MVSLPDFHDGFLDGVLVCASSAVILLRTVTEQRYTLQLNEVDVLRANDFRKENIIFELNLLSPGHLDNEFIFAAYDFSDQFKEQFVLEEGRGRPTRNALRPWKLPLPTDVS